jgi:hypothetical protein
MHGTEDMDEMDDSIVSNLPESEEVYLLQDTRSFCGNNVMFWAKRGGYTECLDEAAEFTYYAAESQNKSRGTDKPIKKSDAEKAAVRTVNADRLWQSQQPAKRSKQSKR